MSSPLKRSTPPSTHLNVPLHEPNSAIGGVALDCFIALYEKNYGIHFEQGEASVKARKLLSLFRLIASHGNQVLIDKTL